MAASLTIAWKEFRSFLNSPLAYIFLILFVLILTIQFFVTGVQLGEFSGRTFWNAGQADLEVFFSLVPIAFVILVPALSMKLWPDELKSGTIELLMTYPLRSWQVVMGKYFAGLYLIAIALLLTLMTPLVVSDYGALDWGPVWGAYLASLLMGAAFLAMGLFFGALFREQVTAFIVTIIICFVLVVVGGGLLSRVNLPDALRGVMDAVSFTSRFNYLGRGVVPLADVLFFVLFAGTFLVLNVTVIECRKGK
ncbi:MAG: ABC transporter permease [Deltaproteobacteria bacterium]|nr:ABC transporter permease [Deltaproteobacteria bacterium]